MPAMSKNQNAYSAKRIAAIERRQQIMDLRAKQKMTYAQIGVIMGIGIPRVSRIVKDEIRRANAERGEEVRTLVNQEVMELDAALKIAWSIASQADRPDKIKLDALGHIQKLTAQRAKILGLETQRIDLTSGGQSFMKIITGISEDDI